MSGLLSRLFCPRETASTPPELEIGLRAMWPGDLDEVLGIERASFPRSWRWHKRDFRGVFDPDCPAQGHVALAAGGQEAFTIVVGFAVSWPNGRHDLVIESLAVRPCFRRRKVASRLVEYVAERCLEAQLLRPPRRFRALVRERNLAAQLFLKSSGWRAAGMIARPWLGCAEDGIKFRKWIGRK
jgi:ribosomal protein S18 acetylase RimI-like enzyme